MAQCINLIISLRALARGLKIKLLGADTEGYTQNLML